ncbi:hypothetical protein [Bordetella parapertussis]|uniref:Uncharacterized protein n=1 Tax=Bordetella parapertussis TaxID=519 RepID=A0ABU5X553_BORPP|nr:hypothetical protein [Bordetella parapertussis]MEB2658828.1 hypothetical protein [Bordetella parapertussis]MEB2663671.1 hypothetical protein [Bordetella parapertussis]MEB2668561.1 hypothetical protein [Bordetella parapertussis]QJP57278.1 hypothetical protein FYB61_06665 [Bordetella parapertussis]QJP64689.1 hypothetical protein FYB56_06670 [Bordetella parapertussis]
MAEDQPIQVRVHIPTSEVKQSAESVIGLLVLGFEIQRSSLDKPQHFVSQ